MSGADNNGLQVSGVGLELGGSRILRGVSANIARGRLVGLIGPNGAGKTSLLRCILGLVKPEAGRVTLDGTDLAGMALKARARLLAYAAQGAPVHWPLNVERIVGLGRVPYLDPWQDLGPTDRAAVEGALEATDCLHLKERVVTTLSGGERARVLLARTLASGAPYILADEPTASLDPFHQLQVMNILKNHAAAGGGVLVVLHDLGLAQRYCDSLILLDRGELVAQGGADEILSDAHLSNVFDVTAVRWSVDGERYLAARAPNGGVKS